jgi:hypothetical protein
VRFVPDERALGWTQDLEELYSNYIGRVTKLVKGGFFVWEVYVDDKTIGFPHVYYRLVEKSKKQ